MSSITDGLVEVSRKTFFAFIGRNVHPRPTRECSVWEDVRSREVVGKSTPGYMGVWDIDGAWPDPHRYFLAPEYAAAKVKP